MSKENTPEDLERTIRLDTKKIMDPYASYDPASIDSIEDILSAEEFSDTPDISFEIPEEAIISTPESIDFDDLTKEMNELSYEFELNGLEEEKEEITPTVIEEKVTEEIPPAVIEEKVTEEVPPVVIEDKPIEKKTTEKVSNISTKEATPKVSSPKTSPSKASRAKSAPQKAKQDTVSNPNTAITNKKEVTKTKIAKTIPKPQKTTANTSKASNSIGFAMIFISLIALVAGVAGIWSSMSSQSQIDALSTQLHAMQSSPLDNQSEIVAMQKQLTSLKQELATLKVKHETPVLIKSEPPTAIQPVKKVAPVVITPVTPIKEVKPVLHKSRWNVIISSHNSLKKAKVEQQKQLAKGMQTSIASVTVKGENWYRIVATGFADKQQAITFTHKLKKQGVSDAWVQYNK